MKSIDASKKTIEKKKKKLVPDDNTTREFLVTAELGITVSKTELKRLQSGTKEPFPSNFLAVHLFFRFCVRS